MVVNVFFIKDMPRLGDPDADLVSRVMSEIGYLYCVFLNRNRASSISLNEAWHCTLSGGLFMTLNTIFLVLDKIDSPNSRPWSRERL
uniref:Uncharacterized protein n=1 Tax=Leersia perrieri TaxID=77586 RepID=A0A0D9XW59_9ORYZ